MSILETSILTVNSQVLFHMSFQKTSIQKVNAVRKTNCSCIGISNTDNTPPKIVRNIRLLNPIFGIAFYDLKHLIRICIKELSLRLKNLTLLSFGDNIQSAKS